MLVVTNYIVNTAMLVVFMGIMQCLWTLVTGIARPDLVGVRTPPPERNLHPP